MTPCLSTPPTNAICIWKDKRKDDVTWIILASQSSFLPLSPSLSPSLPPSLPCSLPHTSQCHTLKQLMESIASNWNYACMYISKENKREDKTRVTRWRGGREREERDREWEEQGRSELTRGRREWFPFVADALDLVWSMLVGVEGVGEAPGQWDAWSSRGTGVDVRWRGSESSWWRGCVVVCVGEDGHAIHLP